MLKRLDAALGRLEVGVCVAAVAALVVSLSFWVVVKGLAAATTSANQAGLVFRAVVGALVLALLAGLVSKRLRLVGAVLGLALAWFWRDVGLHWAGNLLNWLQDGSTLTLMGGLRGVATRLTLLLALAGAALATAAGRHVSVDVLSRALPERLRRVAAYVGGLTAAVVCLACAWGFVDFIAVDAFRVSPQVSAGERVSALTHGLGRNAFLFRQQLSFDLTVLPRVLGGTRWDAALRGDEWNASLQNGWSAWYRPDQVESLRDEPGSQRAALIATPGEAARGLLVKGFNLVIPLGLVWLALRFLLWCLLGAKHADAEGQGSTSPRASMSTLVGLPSLLGAVTGWPAGVVGFAALLGTPLFVVMGGAASLGWLTAHEPLRHLAPRVLDEQFAGSPVLVTIPLFTLLGYVLAESKAPDRLVSAARAWLGWLPGGLAVVCLCASAFFTALTGGSGVTIVAIGGLLLPTLAQQKYPERFSLGLVTTGGSLGLLFPPSLAILVYALVAGLDFATAFKAGLLPGLLVLAMLAAYAIWVGAKEKTPRERPQPRAMVAALGVVKWELGLPVVILLALGSGLAGLDECAALAAAYVVAVELLVHRDLQLKRDGPRVLQQAMALSGAVIVLLMMANALMNFVVQRHVPEVVLESLTALGLSSEWQFLIAMNLFLLVVGVVMDGFSAIIVSVPLVLPFAARFHLHPFHLAMMVILNLELAFCVPPLGLNLFIASFRFRQPLALLYRSVLPFVGLLAGSLGLVMAIPPLSTVLVESDIAQARAEAEARGEPPRDAWRLQCVQEDPGNPQPCTEEDAVRWARDAGASEDEDDALLQQMLGK